MTSLPERLRSLARGMVDGSSSHATVTEAAEELDLQAVRIRRLEYELAGIVRRASRAMDKEPPDQADVPIEKLRAYVEDEVIVSPEVDAARWYAAPDPPEDSWLHTPDPLDTPVTRREASDGILEAANALIARIRGPK